jgi:hypothetical protein
MNIALSLLGFNVIQSYIPEILYQNDFYNENLFGFILKLNNNKYITIVKNITLPGSANYNFKYYDYDAQYEKIKNNLINSEKKFREAIKNYNDKLKNRPTPLLAATPPIQTDADINGYLANPANIPAAANLITEEQNLYDLLQPLLDSYRNIKNQKNEIDTGVTILSPLEFKDKEELIKQLKSLNIASYIVVSKNEKTSYEC